MATIVSRTNNDASRLKELQELVVKYSMGLIGYPGAGSRFDVGTTVEDALFQVGELMKGQQLAIESQNLHLSVLDITLKATTVELELAQEMLSLLCDDIDYDEALDHATTDLMDAVASSGAADTNADGELVFDERVTFSKEDLKPYLRTAIVTWIEERMSK